MKLIFSSLSRNSVKGLINIIDNDENKCFLWVHFIHFNPLKIHPERITKSDNNIVSDLDYDGIEFPIKKILTRLKRKLIFVLMCFVMKIICLSCLCNE